MGSMWRHNPKPPSYRPDVADSIGSPLLNSPGLVVLLVLGHWRLVMVSDTGPTDRPSRPGCTLSSESCSVAYIHLFLGFKGSCFTTIQPSKYILDSHKAHRSLKEVSSRDFESSVQGLPGEGFPGGCCCEKTDASQQSTNTTIVACSGLKPYR